MDPDLISGQESWLGVPARETETPTWETLALRVPVLPTLYAVTALPGPRIEGEPTAPDGAVPKPTLDGHCANGKAVWGNTTSTGTAVHGKSTTGFGVYSHSPVTCGLRRRAAVGGGLFQQ